MNAWAVAGLKTCLLVLMLLPCSQLPAQALPQQVDFQELGIRFDIPPGWTGYLEGEAIVMGHSSIPGMMIMIENPSTSMAQLRQLAAEGINEPAIRLSPMGEFTERGQHRLEGEYQGMFNGQAVRAYALALIDGQGKGVSIISLTTTQQYGQQQQVEANKLAESVRFYQARDSEATVFWKNKIVGRQLRYMHTSSSSDYDGGYTGSSDRVTFDLCGDYQFVYASSSQASFEGSGGFGHAAGQGGNNGSYTIYSVGNSSYLTLTYADGNTEEYALSTNQQGNTFLDGTRYLVTEPERCQ